MGQRRLARHWSVSQLQAELGESYHIPLSFDAILAYLGRYQTMLAARQQDPQQMANAYAKVDALVLSIDGLQPEKGHETLYTVREWTAKRIWFAEALLSSSQDEVRRLLTRAREWAQRLGKPVRLWVSDKQDAFVKGIAATFPGTPHRYCDNHFLRDLAKPMLETDSTVKVQMRKKVRGLRQIEREILQRRQAKEVAPPAPTLPGDSEPAGQVVLDYCAAVRGILNDDQGGPLHPPGIRMAEALVEVRASLGRLLALNKPGRAHVQLERLAACIDRGLAAVRVRQEHIREQGQAIQEVAATLDVNSGTLAKRKAKYKGLQRRYERQGGEFYTPHELSFARHPTFQDMSGLRSFANTFPPSPQTPLVGL
jgi:hypothetical protein